MYMLYGIIILLLLNLYLLHYIDIQDKWTCTNTLILLLLFLNLYTLLHYIDIQDKWTYTNTLIYKHIQLDYTQCTQNANYISTLHIIIIIIFNNKK